VLLFRPSVSFLAEAQPRLKNRRRQKAFFWQKCTLNFLGDCTNYKAKDIIAEITNLFCIFFFQIDCGIIVAYNYRKRPYTFPKRITFFKVNINTVALKLTFL
jgi:hypothetical protein